MKTKKVKNSICFLFPVLLLTACLLLQHPARGVEAEGYILNPADLSDDEVLLRELRVETLPTQIAYREGEVFNPEGLAVTAVFSDDTEETVTRWSWEPAGALTTEDDRVVIRYGDGAAVKSAEVPIIVWPRETLTGAVYFQTPAPETPRAAILASAALLLALVCLTVFWLRRKKTPAPEAPPSGKSP